MVQVLRRSAGYAGTIEVTGGETFNVGHDLLTQN
jgi:hypothetical protein